MSPPPLISSSHLPKLIQEPKFYSRVLSKESSSFSSSDLSSFRIYYGVASGSVPFLWESQPGTPKHPLPNSSLPPLNPPPSSYISTTKNHSFAARSSQKHNNNSSSTLFQSLLPSRLRNHRRAHSSASSSSSSSSSSNSRADEDENEEAAARLSPTSTLCFGRHTRTGCYSVVGLKRALLSFVGN